MEPKRDFFFEKISGQNPPLGLKREPLLLGLQGAACLPPPGVQCQHLIWLNLGFDQHILERVDNSFANTKAVLSFPFFQIFRLLGV